MEEHSQGKRYKIQTKTLSSSIRSLSVTWIQSMRTCRSSTSHRTLRRKTSGQGSQTLSATTTCGHSCTSCRSRGLARSMAVYRSSTRGDSSSQVSDMLGSVGTRHLREHLKAPVQIGLICELCI